MTLPTIPKDRNWSPETWRAGLDEAVRHIGWPETTTWADFVLEHTSGELIWTALIAHATTLLDAGIVKPVVSEALLVCREYRAQVSPAKADLFRAGELDGEIIDFVPAMQSALDKARAGE